LSLEVANITMENLRGKCQGPRSRGKEKNKEGEERGSSVEKEPSKGKKRMRLQGPRRSSLGDTPEENFAHPKKVHGGDQRMKDVLQHRVR